MKGSFAKNRVALKSEEFLRKYAENTFLTDTIHINPNHKGWNYDHNYGSRQKERNLSNADFCENKQT